MRPYWIAIVCIFVLYILTGIFTYNFFELCGSNYQVRGRLNQAYRTMPEVIQTRPKLVEKNCHSRHNVLYKIRWSITKFVKKGMEKGTELPPPVVRTLYRYLRFLNFFDYQLRYWFHFQAQVALFSFGLLYTILLIFIAIFVYAYCFNDRSIGWVIWFDTHHPYSYIYPIPPAFTKTLVRFPMFLYEYGFSFSAGKKQLPTEVHKFTTMCRPWAGGFSMFTYTTAFMIVMLPYQFSVAMRAYDLQTGELGQLGLKSRYKWFGTRWTKLYSARASQTLADIKKSNWLIYPFAGFQISLCAYYFYFPKLYGIFFL